jgi:two-component system, NtrC family, nitrogen regulation response regulator GlnG
MGERVVVVEDDADILYVLAEALANEGYIAVPFDRAGPALEEVVARPPDVLVTDLSMPGMSGQELVTQVRERLGEDVPILVISASANARLAAELPIQAFISKPFDLGDLLAQVAHWACVLAQVRTIRGW